MGKHSGTGSRKEKGAEKGSQAMAVEKDGTKEANRIEDDQPPARDVQPRERGGGCDATHGAMEFIDPGR
jgi:hypothetical protein